MLTAAPPHSVHLGDIPIVAAPNPEPRRTMPHRLAHHPLLLALSAAISRPLEFTPLSWLLGTLGSLAVAVWDDAFTGIFLLAGVFSFFDLQWGARVATHEGRYDAEAKRRGRDQKLITLTLLLGLRAAEYWAARHGILDVGKLLQLLGLDVLALTSAAHNGGLISALICAGVWWDEVQSWYEHRSRLGGKRIILLGKLITLGQALQRRGTARARIAASRRRPATASQDKAGGPS